MSGLVAFVSENLRGGNVIIHDFFKKTTIFDFLIQRWDREGCSICYCLWQ
ncbi:MAG: hypothetical protein N5P05_001372 [Chroococcopsis gigantea SAG 12.99]|nr:hypothetical protein [Chroococcopsis gigantea SAG 12.99]